MEIFGAFGTPERWAERLRRSVHAVVPDPVALALLYLRAHGRMPELLHPASFTEKVLWRAAFDRRPILSHVSDKAHARERVIRILGEGAAPRLLFSTTEPRDIPFEDLPSRFVLKPAHASGAVAIVRDRDHVDEGALVEASERWMARSYYAMSHEWVYKDVVPRILVEEFVGGTDGSLPRDFKVFVFCGVARLVQVDTGRFTGLRRAFYSPSWKRLGARMAVEPLTEAVREPPFLEDMLAAAERVASGFDFLRVDCLASADRFFVNELSVTPGRGLCPFEPRSFDLALGERWELPRSKSERTSVARRLVAGEARLRLASVDRHL